MASPSSARSFWDDFAPRYDRFMSHFSPGYPALVLHLDADLRAQGAVDILEIATGTGQIALELTQRDAHRRISAIDYAPEMIALAQAKAKTLCQAPTFSTADACDLPFPDDSFDAVICANALHLLPQPELALAEIHRVLRPAGLAYLPTYCHGQTLRAQILSRCMGLFGFPGKQRFKQSTLRNLVESSGLQVVASHLNYESIPLCYLQAQLPA